jgi:Niemann-Pick C1 protein
MEYWASLLRGRTGKIPRFPGYKANTNIFQLDALSSNLAKANNFISACPACKENFYNLFCTFTCSPNQSLFINITQTEKSDDKVRVTELDQLISDEYGSGFYDSCKDVKFGPTNTNAMSFIGGGAKNYPDFLHFLGKKNPPFGSPFQINFPAPSNYTEPSMKPQDMTPKKCNDEDENFRCACVDCPDVCPKLPEVAEAGSCHVGLLSCLSFGAILVYSIILLLLATAIFGHIAYAKHARRKSERLRLLQDAAPSDDEDEGDMVHNVAMYDRPQKNYWINTVCDSAFSRLGYTAARFPGITIGISILVVGLLSIGWARFEIETNPARLWVSPTSAAAQEKNFFDENFGPFYRAEQVFLVNDTHPERPGPVLSYETLKWWIDVEDRISELKGKKGTSLEDVCFKPTGDACVVQSVAAWFGNDIQTVSPSTWKQKLRSCAESNVNCLPKFGQPIDPEMILGGLEDSQDVADAPAIIVTWVVRNAPEGSPEAEKAMDWEETLKSTLLKLQKEAAARGLRLSFSTEISLEQELNKSTNTDAKIVVISYIIMFFYASLALGSTTLSLRSIISNPATSFVESKFTLGVVGILIVLMSISASIGLFSAAGIKVTLIIAEVIPFIVLAVGVDNIFLIVHEFERVNVSHPDDMVEVRIAKALGRMGPSILLSAVTETIAFALGAFVGMPAVRNFAVYAAGAVFINAVLQVTMFISVLTLNQRRVEDRRADCFPCIQIKSASVHLGNSNGNEYSYARSYEGQDESSLQAFIRKTYAPMLLGRKMKVAVVVIFLGIFTAGVSLIPEVTLGLDQRVAIPDDSYLIPYFNDLYDYFESGPPVYFVTRELNVTERVHQQQLCARFTTCQSDSLTNIVEQERKRPNISYIATTPANWVDDYFRWLDPSLQCCVEGGKACFEDRDPGWNITLYGMPEGQEFIDYLEKWIVAPTDENCPLGGRAPYSNALVIDPETVTIPASHFRSSHTPLRSQEDFIAAYASARRISDDVSENTGIEVFPYSVFYIFFDQYATIIKLTAALLGSALALILVISSILLGSVKTGAVVTATVIMVVVDIIGTMAVFNVSLNAVSLVNLVICVGIGVEFCAHIARAFMFPSRAVMERAKNKFRGRDARAWNALVNVGGSVFSGITITKLLGVFVLAFTRSKIFEIYYFRIWLALVLFAATHALIFLPVALSLVGGEGYVDPESDGGLEEDLASRRYRALLPDEDDSDGDY